MNYKSILLLCLKVLSRHTNFEMIFVFTMTCVKTAKIVRICNGLVKHNIELLVSCFVSIKCENGKVPSNYLFKKIGI